KRYPWCDKASALLYSCICMRTVQALMVLAFNGPQMNPQVIVELKTMIRTYLQEVFEPETTHG
ncbi:MAG TPA: hypothetical protein VKR06_20760, partial [Ktedonosporobacter sp.]|nr:hypothetical protein [Ktedonosporobacter sp.]